MSVELPQMNNSRTPSNEQGTLIRVCSAVYIFQMEETQKCCQCFRGFEVKRLPHSLDCSHNICDTCLEEVRGQQILICQFCQKTHQVRDLADLPFNQDVRLELQQQPLANRSQELQEINEQQGQILLEQSPCLAPAARGDICPEHNVVMDIICLTEKKKICPHCALFGSHKHHAFRRIDDFQKQIQQKQHMFLDILSEKEASRATSSKEGVKDTVRAMIRTKKEGLVRELDSSVQNWMESLSLKRQLILDEIEQYFKDLDVHLSQSLNLEECQQAKDRFESWQESCSAGIKQLELISDMEQKLKMYFNGPLEIISEGYIYLEKYGQQYNHIMAKVKQKINLQLHVEAELFSAIDKSLKLLKPGFSPINSLLREEENNDTNPFLDCNSSGIFNAPQSMVPQHNTSIDQISSLTSSMKFTRQRGTEPRKRETLKPTAAGEKRETADCNAYKRKTIGGFLPEKEKGKSSRASERISIKSSQRAKTTVQGVVLQTDQKHYNPKQPQKLFSDFMKNTLTDFFDLSDCHLPCEQVVEYVAKARKSHRIKGLKLCANNLDNSGFQKMVEFLKGVTNINLANNSITQAILQTLLRNREQFDLLRVVNLSHNPISLDRKSKARLQELKKMGVIVIL